MGQEIALSKKTYTFMILFLMVSQWHPSTSLRCSPCHTYECKDEPNPWECKSGQLTSDVCDCCNVCAKTTGEKCSGWWASGVYGDCADYLYCDVNRKRKGVCKPNTCKIGKDCYKKGMMCDLTKNLKKRLGKCVCTNGKCRFLGF